MAKNTTITSSIRPKTYQDAIKEGQQKRGGLTPGNMLDDFKMAIGLKPKTGLFNLQTRQSMDRRKQLLEDMKERRRRKNRRKPKGETAAEREARLKREALAKERAEGQVKRRKFEREKGERIARLKAKLLNLA